MAIVAVQFGVGLLLLVAGRKLYWLFVGAVGFAAGIHVAIALLPQEPPNSLLAILLPLVLGIVGAVFALVLQKLAVVAAGFLLGASCFTTLLDAWALQAPGRAWISLLIGGIIGAICMALFFDPALIVLSSILGARMIVEPFHLRPLFAAISFVALAVLGIGFQFRTQAKS